MIGLAVAFLAGIICGAAAIVMICAVALVRMHKVEQNARAHAVKVTPVILKDSGELH